MTGEALLRRLAGIRHRLFVRRLGLAYLRAANRLRGPGPRSTEPVRIVLQNAYGMGGTVRTCFTYAERLGKRHDVEIVSVVRPYAEPRLPLPDGVRLTVLDDRTGRRGLLARLPARIPSVLQPPGDGARSSCSLLTDLLLYRYLRRLRGGVVITTRPGQNVISALLTPPGVITIGQEHMHLTRHHPYLRQMIKRRYRRLDAVVTLTETDRANYRARVPAARVEVIPNSVTPLSGRPAEGKARTVIAVGRLHRQKGFDLLIEAWREVAQRHAEWQLLIFGSGPARAELRDLIAKYGLKGKVRLKGRDPEIGERFAESSIFVLSSRWEGLPLVLIEAMSKGLPPVAFDCPTGPGDVIVPGENGLLVPPNDVPALAAGLCALIEDPARRRRLGEAATHVADRYAPELIGAHWETLLDDLVKSRMS